MKYDIENIEELVKNNNLKEVTSSNIWSTKTKEPDEKGIASYEIFGRPGTEDRKRSFAYISLNDYFIHPHVYNVLLRWNRNLRDLFSGYSQFYVKDGKLIKVKGDDEESKKYKTGTGTKFLYDVWSELNLKPNKNTMVDVTYERVYFLNSLPKDVIFITKWLVIPPFYRDVDMHSNTKNELNKLYCRIINNAVSIKTSQAMFAIFGTTPSHVKIQETLNEIYLSFIDMIGGTKGYIHKHIMGKTTDFAARCIISMAKYDGKTLLDSEVTFTHSCVPLSVIIKAAAPFIIYGVRKVIERILAGSDFIYDLKDGKVNRIELHPKWVNYISSDNINKLIDLYYESQEHRLDHIMLPGMDNKKYPLYYISDTPEINVDNKLSFDDMILEGKAKIMNLTELFYMAAYDTVKDKCIYTTRYPIESQHNIYPSLMNIIPCNKYEKRVVEGIEYPRFPILDKEQIKDIPLRQLYTDTLIVHPSFLKALGGDYDGDMVSNQIAFTNEANAEAREYITSKTNIISPNGDTMREFSELANMGAFMMTYRYDKT
jgi:DNA-directed RNA polymerase beta' subunit